MTDPTLYENFRESGKKAYTAEGFLREVKLFFDKHFTGAIGSFTANVNPRTVAINPYALGKLLRSIFAAVHGRQVIDIHIRNVDFYMEFALKFDTAAISPMEFNNPDYLTENCGFDFRIDGSGIYILIETHSVAAMGVYADADFGELTDILESIFFILK